jgi:hypothetical protein
MRAAIQLHSQVDVCDPVFAQLLGKALAVELRIHTTVRRGSYIANRAYVVGLQKTKNLFKAMGGVPYGQYLLRRCHTLRPLRNDGRH